MKCAPAGDDADGHPSEKRHAKPLAGRSARKKIRHLCEGLTPFAVISDFCSDHGAKIESSTEREIDVGAVHHDQPPRREGREAISGEAAVAHVQAARPVGLRGACPGSRAAWPRPQACPATWPRRDPAWRGAGRCRALPASGRLSGPAPLPSAAGDHAADRSARGTASVGIVKVMKQHISSMHADPIRQPVMPPA